MKAEDFFKTQIENMRELWHIGKAREEMICLLMERYAALHKTDVGSSLSSSPEIKEIEDRMFLDVKNADTPEKLLRVISFYELEPEEAEVGYNQNRQNFLRLIINKIYDMTPNIELKDVISH